MLQYLTLKHEVHANAEGVGGKLLDKTRLHIWKGQFIQT
jgi:hypothetical protein